MAAQAMNNKFSSELIFHALSVHRPMLLVHCLGIFF